MDSSTLIIDDASTRDPDNADNPDLAVRTAQSLVNDGDTLMVIGHLPSRLTEAALPVYLGARPAIPYISTTASDDNLLSSCSSCTGSALMQLSPNNNYQAKSAITFAREKSVKKFLVVTEGDPEKDPYERTLSDDFKDWVPRYGGVIVDRFNMGMPPSERQQILQNSKPECVLYAGQAGSAETLINFLEANSVHNALVILSDSVIESRVDDSGIKGHSSIVHFTYADDADDYNSHTHRYGKDATLIARKLVEDLNQRGGDFSYRIRSLIHRETIESARKNLIRIMVENAERRAWYPCESTADGSGMCIFDYQGYHKRRNGMFHVWQLAGGNKPAMIDIDGWHPPRGLVH